MPLTAMTEVKVTGSLQSLFSGFAMDHSKTVIVVDQDDTSRILMIALAANAPVFTRADYYLVHKVALNSFAERSLQMASLAKLPARLPDHATTPLKFRFPERSSPQRANAPLKFGVFWLSSA